MSKHLIMIVALLVALASHNSNADDFGTDWARVLENFIDKKIPRLTRDYAENDLKKRWLDAFLGPLTRVSIIQDDIVRRVNISSHGQTHEKLDVATAIQMLKDLQLDLAVLRFDLARLSEVKNELVNLSGSCDNDAIIGSNAIASVGTLSIGNIALADGPYYFILWDPSLISTIVSVIYDFVAWLDDDSKRKRALKALDRMPSKIYSAGEAVSLSRKICKEIYLERAQSIDDYLFSVQAYRQALEKQEATYWATYKEIEFYLSSAAFTEVLSRAGIWQEEVRQSQSVASAHLLLDLELANNELRGLKTAAISSNSCRDGIIKIELYEDALVELQVQLKEYRKLEQLPEVTARMKQVQENVNHQLATLPKIFSTARDRKCLDSF